MGSCLLVKGLLRHLPHHARSHGLGSRHVLLPEQALQLSLCARLPLARSCYEALLKGGQGERRAIALVALRLLQQGCSCCSLCCRTFDHQRLSQNNIESCTL